MGLREEQRAFATVHGGSLWNILLSSQGGLTGGNNRWLERKLKDQENSKAVGSQGSKQESWKSQTSPCVTREQA